MSLLIFIVSIIPGVLIILWLMRRRKEDEPYKKSCRSALVRGLIAVLPIVGASAVFFLVTGVLKLTVLRNVPVLIHRAIYTFIVLAFAEELVKYLAFRLLLKKNYNDYTWADVTAFMVIIGTAFGLVEDIPYAIGASPAIMLVRGFTMGHVGYAFVMGWFYGKKLHTGKNIYGILAFLLPFLLHGLYDFSLSEELLEINDNLAAIGITLAVFDIVLLVLMIRFFLRARKRACYNEALRSLFTKTETLDESGISGGTPRLE